MPVSKEGGRVGFRLDNISAISLCCKEDIRSGYYIDYVHNLTSLCNIII